MCAQVAPSRSSQIESESESESERESWHHPDLLVSLRSCTESQQRFLRSAFHSTFMSAGDKRKFIEKIQTWAKEKFCGSGDPEVEDAVDCIDFFESMFGSSCRCLRSCCRMSAHESRPWTHLFCVSLASHMCRRPQQGATHTNSNLLHECLRFGRRIPSMGNPK